MTQKVLSYDLGGTKIAVGIINRRGQILDELREPALFEQGKQTVLNQLVDLGRGLLRKHSGVRTVGMASAGPLDMEKGILLDPTNFVSSKGTWGKVRITQILSRKLKLPVFLENDAAAAILAEHWAGAAKKYRNAMVLTLGTGLGTGIICNGSLVRAGRGLHPEAGHMIINFKDPSAPCGCGNTGCAEAYLSGTNFASRARARLGQFNLSAKDIVDLARKGNTTALAAFSEYAEIMAIAIHNYARIYCPEIVIFTGSFAQASDLFIKDTKKHSERLLSRVPELLPKLTISSLSNEAGLLGAAYVAFHRTKEYTLQ